ncbi:MAG TPA: enoyl-CoA hydratase/isomerase family protein [Steroidobacteraceae bacterium]|nr:enoyl-CoA hydratase/isomerase family protein [Steroidobacteraceae bacterium]
MAIDVAIGGRVAFVTLNRPAVLNALSLQMIGDLERAMRRAADEERVGAVLLRGAGEKAFCAGGDLRALYESHRDAAELHRDFFIAEYRLDYFLHGFAKPLIALADGITMGGGMGLAQAAALRVVGERTRMAMPEVGIGMIPDVGGSYFLSRLPGALGLYLALTGTTIGAADALFAGLADLYLAPAAMARIEETLGALAGGASPGVASPGGALRCADVRAALEAVAAAAPTAALAPLAPLSPAIDRHFTHAGVPAILASLQAEADPQFASWAAETAELLRRRSPTMLAVAQRLLERGKRLTLAECFRMEFGVVQHCFRQGDFLEGVRALIIDKDKRPVWRPQRIEEVSESMVEAFFREPPPLAL